MKSYRFTVEHCFYGLALVLALILRTWSLGAKPLSDIESGWALQALSVAHGEPIALGAQLGYIFPTGLLFWLIGSSDFLARLWPALAGGLLVLAPFFLRHRLGRGAALVAAFGLAIDPGLVALSRLAGGPMPAIGLGFLALSLAITQNWAAAGIFTGLALLSGPAILQGLLILIFAWGVAKALGKAMNQSLSSELSQSNAITSENLRRVGLAVVGVILLVGTLFFRYPQGLGAWLSALPAYLHSWTSSSEIPWQRLLIVLVIYQPLALFFGLDGAALAWIHLRDGSENARLRLLCSLGLVASILLALLTPGRGVTDLGWVLVILWILAGIGLVCIYSGQAYKTKIVYGLGLAFLILMAFLWMQLATISQLIPGTRLDYVRIIVLLALIILGGLLTWLVSAGWSWGIARLGLACGLVCSLGIYTFSNVWGIVQLKPELQEIDRQELWTVYPVTGQAGLLLSTIGDLSEWKTGRREALDITVAIDVPSIRWALRSYPNVKYLPEHQSLAHLGEEGSDLPSLILSRQEDEAPNLTTVYKGEGFGWWLKPDWSGTMPPDFLRWLVFRQAPWQNEQVILWARGDLFPGGAVVPKGTGNVP